MNIFSSYPNYICVEGSRIVLKKILSLCKAVTLSSEMFQRKEKGRQNRSTLEVSMLLIFCQACSWF